MDIVLAKVICALVLLAISLTFGLIPIKIVQLLKRKQDSNSLACGWEDSKAQADYILSLLNCAAGGIFLATFLLYLFPELDDIVHEMLKLQNSKTDFPLAMFLVACGFFLVMVLEHTIMQLQHHCVKDHHDDHDHEEGNSEESITIKSDNTTCYGTMAEGDAPQRNDVDVLHRVYHDEMDKLLAQGDSEVAPLSVTRDDAGCIHVIHTTHHQHHHNNPNQLHSLRSLVLLLALSLHMVFEGLALGLQASASQLWALLGAVCLHKSIIAFTTGLQFAESLGGQNGKGWGRVIMYVVLYSMMAPLGTIIGTAVNMTQSPAANIAGVTLQGFSAGTFLYVTFFEVLEKEVGQDHNITKVMVILIAFGCMAVLRLVLPS